MKGDATRTNYALTALWGPQFNKATGRFELGGSHSYSNSITGAVPTSQVRWPSGLESFKGIFGQRVLKQP